MRNEQKETKQNFAHFHLPGLFQFYELYSRFLKLYFEHREYFYPWAEISSIYGAPSDCLWAGGRIGGEAKPKEVFELLKRFAISARLTLSNSLLAKEHLTDRNCNKLCDSFLNENGNGAIVTSDLLLDYLKAKYPKAYFVSSTTKVLTDFKDFKKELDREEFSYVVPDFRLNKKFDELNQLSQLEKDKTEFLVNECCYIGCKERKQCYESVSHLALGDDAPEHVCQAPNSKEGYRFSNAMKNPSFIGINDIQNTYLPLGFSNFKIEGRGLGSALVFEMLLYYLVRPEFQIKLREDIYLDNELDLF